MEESLKHLSDLFIKYGNNPVHISILNKLCVNDLEQILIEKIKTAKNTENHQNICYNYVQKFCQKYLHNYWYHPFNQSYYIVKSHRLVKVPEDHLQPLLSDLLEKDHQPLRHEILLSIKKKIQERTIINNDYNDFIPTNSMIQRVKNLFSDTFEDCYQIEYFLWYIGYAIDKCLLDKSNQPEVMIWIGSHIDIWIEWLKQSIHDQFKKFPTILSDIKQSYHNSYPLSMVRVLHFHTNGFTLRSKYTSDNDVLLFLLVAYHYYHRLYKQKIFQLDVDLSPQIFFISQFQSSLDIFQYVAKQCLELEYEENKSGCYLYEVVDIFHHYLLKSGLPKNLLTKREITIRMEQFYSNHQKTKQWYQGLILSKIVKSKYVKEFLLNSTNLSSNCIIPLTIDQLKYYYHQWISFVPNKRNSEIPKKEFLRYLQDFYPELVIREETAFQCEIKQFSITKILEQYFNQYTEYSYQHFQQWFKEVYPNLENITSWQYNLFQNDLSNNLL